MGWIANLSVRHGLLTLGIDNAVSHGLNEFYAHVHTQVLMIDPLLPLANVFSMMIHEDKDPSKVLCLCMLML